MGYVLYDIVCTVMYHTCLHNSLYNLEGLSFKYYISHQMSAKIICVMYIYNMYVYNQSSKGWRKVGNLKNMEETSSNYHPGNTCSATKNKIVCYITIYLGIFYN